MQWIEAQDPDLTDAHENAVWDALSAVDALTEIRWAPDEAEAIRAAYDALERLEQRVSERKGE